MKTYTIKTMSPQLQVADLERAISFYTGRLGFRLDFRYEDFYAGIVKDGASIHLKCGERRKDFEMTFSVEDVEGAYAALAGVDVVQPLREMPYGKEFYIADPDGNVLAFLQTH